MAIRKIVSRSILDGTVQTVDLAAGSLSSSGLDVTGGGGTGAALLPKGTTGQRPASPVTGYIRFNTTTDCYEQYTSLGWASISAPPAITTISPTTYSGETGTTITVNGANFAAGATVTFITNAGTAYAASATTFVNTSQVTATTPQDFTLADEPLDVKVTNPNGLSTTLADSLDCGSSPSWTTASGNVFDGADDDISTSIAATDPDSGATITYGATSLPAGVSINTSTGAITGSLSTPVSSATTYSFTGSATDNAGNANTRSFNIITRPTLATAASYPLSGANFAMYNTAWTGSSSNLYDLGHAASTFRVPANVYAIRVLVWGCGQTNNGNNDSGYGGFTSAILRVTPQEYYKVIVGGGGTVGAGVGGTGGNGASGMGGGAAQDGNDYSTGGAGSGFFYAANTGGTTVTDEATMFTKGVLIAGGGAGCANGTSGGNGNAGSTGTFTVAGITGYGANGGNGSGSNGGGGGLYTNSQGGIFYNQGNTATNGGTRGNTGTFAADGFGGNYGGGSGSGAGAGGVGGGSGTYTLGGEAATGDGGRGRSNYTGNLNTAGPGLGGLSSNGESTGGNGFRFNSINLGAGAPGGHGGTQAAGGWSSGGSAYYNRGAGGGSGIAFGYMSGTTPTLSSWVNPNTVTVAGGNANSIGGVPTTAGAPRLSVTSATGYPGAVLIMW